MIYDIDMPREDFDAAEAIVLNITKRCKPRKLCRITSDTRFLQPENRSYIEDDPSCLGVTFSDTVNRKFDIWISPVFTDWGDPWAIDTVLHELTHGYAGILDHGTRFRRTMAKALFTYEDQIQNIRAGYMTRRMISQYSTDNVLARRKEWRDAKDLVRPTGRRDLRVPGAGTSLVRAASTGRDE